MRRDGEEQKVCLGFFLKCVVDGMDLISEKKKMKKVEKKLWQSFETAFVWELSFKALQDFYKKVTKS